MLSAALDLFFILLMTLISTAGGQPVWSAVHIFGWLVPLVCFGGLWLLGRRGSPSELLLRTVEVFATGCVCCAFPLVLLGGVAGAAIVVGLHHVSVFMGCALLLRAALVPSPAWLSLALGIVITIPLVVVAVIVADFDAAPSVSRATGAAVTSAIPSLAFAIVAAIVSRTVYGLQSRVREALQLGQYTLEEKIGCASEANGPSARHVVAGRLSPLRNLDVNRHRREPTGKFRIIATTANHCRGPDCPRRRIRRLALVDITDPASPQYRFLLLVNPIENQNWDIVDIHAGGIAWFGDYLYVASTGLGLRVFDMRRILQADTTEDVIGCDGAVCKAGLYKYVLPKVGIYERLTPCDPAPIFSFVGLDRSTSPPALVTGEYCSEPAGGAGALYRVDARGRSAFGWIDTPEDLMVDGPAGVLFGLSEATGERAVFAADLAAFD